MKRNIILVKEQNLWQAERCCHGVVHLHILCKGVSIHFDEDCFLRFASMIDKAATQLMDEGLADLLNEEE